MDRLSARAPACHRCIAGRARQQPRDPRRRHPRLHRQRHQRGAGAAGYTTGGRGVPIGTLLAQGTPFGHMNEGSAERAEYWTDSWTGYPPARQRVIDALQAARASNPVILGGDIHAFIVSGINAVPERPDTPLVAAEFRSERCWHRALLSDT